MKYKKGDIVRIRKDLESVMFDMPETFSKLCKHAGKTVQISDVSEWFNNYVIRIDGEVYCCRESWLEPVQKENYPMSPADALKKATMIVETLNVKEFNIQCTDGIFEFTMAKDLEGK